MKTFNRSSLVWMLLVGLLPIACARQQVFKPAGYKWPVHRGEIASWKHGVLPGSGLDSNFEVFTDGIVKRNVGGRKVPSLLVHLSVTNKTDKKMTIDGAQSHVLDNKGRFFRPGAVVKNGGQQFFARIKPQSHVLMDLFYDIPRGIDGRKINSFTVHWRYTVDRKPYTQSALFEQGYAVE